MKIISTPRPANRASISGVMSSYLDRDHATNDQVTDEDHERSKDQERPADDARELRPEIGRRDEEHEGCEYDGQEGDQGSRRTRLRGQSRDLTLDPDALADGVRDVVEDLRQVSTDGAVDRISGRHEVEVSAGDALGDVLQSLVGRSTEVHLAHSSPKLIRDRGHRVLRDRVDRLRERVAGLDRVRQQGESVAQLVVEGSESLVDPVLDVEAGGQVAEDRRQQAEE